MMKSRSLTALLTPALMIASSSLEAQTIDARAMASAVAKQYEPPNEQTITYPAPHRDGYLVCINDMSERPSIAETIVHIPKGADDWYIHQFATIKDDISSWPYYFYLDHSCEETLSRYISFEFK